MKRVASLMVATALAAAPLAANAQGHGHMGGFGHGFSHTTGGPAFHGGFHHFHGCCFGPGPFAFGLFLGLAASPWYWGPDPWWGYYGPYDYDYPYPPPPPPGAQAAPQACGNWVWQSGPGRYVWAPAPCAGGPPPPPAPPPPAA
jgi:hypothetical protein